MKKDKNGISLIVLIISIIVIIILVSTIMLTVTKDNSISNAKEATFKQDMLTIQDEYAMYLSNKYREKPTEFKQESVNLSGDEMVNELPSTKKYKDRVSIVKGNITWIGENETEHKWFLEVINVVENSDDQSKDETEDDATKYGVPIPNGFKYKEGTKETGFVIQDENGNEFVWVVANKSNYAKDLSFPHFGTPIGDDSLPTGITDEAADVEKYGGFYIGRYEAGIPDGDTKSSNKTGIPVSKKGATVWNYIDYNNSKASAEKMISNKYVQTGLLTGTAWDTTCHWIEDSLNSINASASLKNSRYYGNHTNSLAPANINNGSLKTAGYSEYWKVKNIYDLAGNVWEWTSENCGGSSFLYRGGSFYYSGGSLPVSFRYYCEATYTNDDRGFRVRLYIK